MLSNVILLSIKKLQTNTISNSAGVLESLKTIDEQLTELSHLLSKEEICTLLDELTSTIDKDLCSALIRCTEYIGSEATHQALIVFERLLILALEKNVNSSNIGNYLNKLTVNSATLGMHIARNGSKKLTANETKQYLQLLFRLLDKGVSAKDLFAHLQLKSAFGVTMGQYIAFNVSNKMFTANEIKQYLQLLSTLLDKGLSAKNIIAHLQLSISNGATLVNSIAHYSPDAIDQFVELIFQLQNKGIDNISLMTFFNSKCRSHKNLIDRLQSDPEKYQAVIRKLIQKNILTYGDLTPSKAMKTVIFNGINAMSDPDEKKHALEDAAGKGILGKEHPLYKFVSTSRYEFFGKFGQFAKADDSKGTLAKLHHELDGLVKLQLEIPWGSQFTNFSTVETFLNRKDIADVIELLSQRDSTGQTLREFLYDYANNYPFVLYLMLKKDLVRQEDYPKLKDMQGKLLTLFANENVPEQYRSLFIETRLTPTTPLNRFMRIS